MKLIALYRSILAYAGLTSDENGYISTNVGGSRSPATIHGERLVLPLPETLKSYSSDVVFFHPLAENTLRGESEVISKLLYIINVRLNHTFGIIAQSLLNLIASPELHKGLSPDQTEVLIAVQDVDKQAVTNFTSIMLNGFKESPDGFFSNIYLRRGISINGKKFARAGMTIFKFYDLLCKETTIVGVKLRQKDIAIFKALCEYILPGIGGSSVNASIKSHAGDVQSASHNYDFGSNSMVAPYLEALLRASALQASRFNDILTMFADYIDMAEDLVFDAEWLDAFEDLEDLLPEIRRIPMQKGNEGSAKVSDTSAATATNLVKTNMADIAAAALNKEERVEEVKKDKITIDFGNKTWVPPQQPQPFRAPGHAPAVEARTSRGLDFRAVVAANAGVAMVQNPLAAYGGGYPNQFAMPTGAAGARATLPTWATTSIPNSFGNPYQNQYLGVPSNGGI